MIETANSIQSFPSTRAISTSFSAGKYSGIGMGSVERGREEEKGNKIQFNFIFPICRKAILCSLCLPHLRSELLSQSYIEWRSFLLRFLRIF
jgi:hypothetical protein